VRTAGERAFDGTVSNRRASGKHPFVEPVRDDGLDPERAFVAGW
jgi:hypothetical protein